MQSALDTRVSLSGDEEVKQRFQEIGRVGQESLDKLKATGKGAGDALKPLHESLDKTHEHSAAMAEALEQAGATLERLPGLFGEVAEPVATLTDVFKSLTEGMTGVVVAAGAVVTALYGIADSASRATIATQDAAKATGLSVEQYETLRFAASSTGVSLEDYAAGIERVAFKLGEARQAGELARKNYEDSIPTLDQMAHAQREAAAAADAAALGVRRSAQAAVVAQHSFEASVRGLKASKEALGDLQQRYAEQLQNTGRGDPALAKQIDDGIQAVKDRQFEQEQQRQNELDRREDDRIRRIKERGEAEDRAAKTKKEADELAAKRDQTALDNNKKMIQSVAAAYSGGGLANTYQAVGALADQYNAMSNQLDRATFAQELFGRNWAKMVPLLELGSQKINQLGKELEDLKLRPSPAETLAAEEFNKQRTRLTQVLEGAKEAIGNVLGQLFTPGFKALSDAITSHMGDIRAAASQLVTFLTPVFKAVEDLVTSTVKTITAATALLNGATGANLSAGLTAIGTALAVVAPRITFFVAALTALREIITGLFGDKAGDLFLPLTAGIYVAIQAIRALTTAIGTLEAVSAPILILVAAIAAVGAAIWIVYGNVDGLSAAIGRVFGEDAKKWFDEFVTNLRAMVEEASTWFRGSFLGRMVDTTIGALRSMIGAWHAFVEMMDAIFVALYESYKNGFLGRFVQSTLDALKYLWGWWVWLNEKLDEAWGKLKRLVGGGVSDTVAAGAEAGAEPAHALGGQVVGRSGIDTVHIRATTGEFVHRVAAVQHYGTDFMNRINNLQVPKGFALGGLIGGFAHMISAPRGYAGGGVVAASGSSSGGMVAVALSHGGENFEVLAPAAVADRLVTHSRREQMKSAGVKPGWFGGV